MIEVERVAVGDEARAASILTEAATWLIEIGQPQWPLESIPDKVSATVAAGEAYVARRDGADVATWFLNAARHVVVAGVR